MYVHKYVCYFYKVNKNKNKIREKKTFPFCFLWYDFISFLVFLFILVRLCCYSRLFTFFLIEKRVFFLLVPVSLLFFIKFLFLYFYKMWCFFSPFKIMWYMHVCRNVCVSPSLSLYVCDNVRVFLICLYIFYVEFVE